MKILGLDVHFIEEGKRENQTIVLIHGWPDLSCGWKYQIEFLKKNYHIIAIDLIGFGKTEGPKELENYTVKKQCDIIIKILDHFQKRKAIVIGHDWVSEFITNLGRKSSLECSLTLPRKSFSSLWYLYTLFPSYTKVYFFERSFKDFTTI